MQQIRVFSQELTDIAEEAPGTEIISTPVVDTPGNGKVIPIYARLGREKEDIQLTLETDSNHARIARTDEKPLEVLVYQQDTGIASHMMLHRALSAINLQRTDYDWTLDMQQTELIADLGAFRIFIGHIARKAFEQQRIREAASHRPGHNVF